MKFILIIFIVVQSVLSESVPTKNGKYAFAYTWSWTTVPTNDGLRNINENQGRINLDSQSPKIKNENYIIKSVEPHDVVHNERPTDLSNDPNYQKLLDFQQRYMKVVRSPDYQQQVNDNLYYNPEDKKMQSGNVQETNWYPINDENTPTHTIVYPNPNPGTVPSTPAIAYAASNVVVPPNLKTFLQNPYGYVNSVAYTQV